MDAQKAERLARGLIQATERSFRDHLGDRAKDRDFIGDLYLSLRRTLGQYDDVEVHKGTEPRGVADELALTVYLVAASRYSDAQVGPVLLDSLRSAIRRALTAADPGSAERGT